MKNSIISMLFVVLNVTDAQWITSTAAESSLFACPGFDPGVVTHPDGSSIVAGYFTNSIYAQKFNDKGYTVWPQYITVHNNDSTNYCTNTRIYSDGNGGAIFVWEDARQLYKYGNSRGLQLIAQRIDSNGQKKWGEGIVIVEDHRNLSRYNITSLNTGNIIIVISVADTGYSGASQQRKLSALSIDDNGGINWKKGIDSCNISSSLEYIFIGTYKDKIFFRTKLLGANFLLDNGNLFQSIDLSSYADFRVDNNLNLFAFKPYEEISKGDSAFLYFPISRYDSNFNFIWKSAFYILREGDGFINVRDIFVVDQKSGMYSISSTYITGNILTTRIYHLDSAGQLNWDIKKVLLQDFGAMLGAATPDGGLMLIYFGDARSAARLDYQGNPLWPNQPITVIKEPFRNAYFTKCESDYIGGFVCAFWRTVGGIYVKHSGRIGRVGVLTKADRINDMITSFNLQQNYPNPFNPKTTIRYTISEPGLVTLSVYDNLGRMVSTLVNEYKSTGNHRIEFDAQKYASGMFFYKIVHGNNVAIRKMLFLK